MCLKCVDTFEVLRGRILVIHVYQKEQGAQTQGTDYDSMITALYSFHSEDNECIVNLHFTSHLLS